jgi:hypothetical protein
VKNVEVAEKRWRCATTWSPVEHSPRTVVDTAAMPDAKARAASARSSDATASSNSRAVGLPKRE